MEKEELDYWKKWNWKGLRISYFFRDELPLTSIGKEFKEYITVADKRVLDTKKSGVELIANDEVFVIENGINNYWISNYGRLTNNLCGNFYMHKMGYAHYTLSVTAFKIETYTDKLLAEHFLEKPDKCNRIWHIDRDRNNCFYRKLVWVNDEVYIVLERDFMGEIVRFDKPYWKSFRLPEEKQRWMYTDEKSAIRLYDQEYFNKNTIRIIIYKGYETEENQTEPLSDLIYYISIDYKIANYFGDKSGMHYRSKRYIMYEDKIYQQQQFGEVKEGQRITKELKGALNEIKR